MVDHPFVVDGLDGKEVYYAVGNPMGAYSSWASFAISHHFVMFVASTRAGVPWPSAKYVILGDDVLIGDSQIEEEYRKILQTLGVDVSKEKTLSSDELCEFAKRYVFRGEEVTPFPISSVSENLGDVSLLVSSLSGEMRKGFIPKSGIPGCVQKLKKITGFKQNSARN